MRFFFLHKNLEYPIQYCYPQVKTLHSKISYSSCINEILYVLISNSLTSPPLTLNDRSSICCFRSLAMLEASHQWSLAEFVLLSDFTQHDNASFTVLAHTAGFPSF